MERACIIDISNANGRLGVEGDESYEVSWEAKL